ncbi:glycosyltransferase family 2 protein [Paracoccus spongiarum]|uniref:Glycosyltransferase family 2 protein n=1 Tax=Paracoccus spongiarum TaxID=3064387 RepID=A0ABT9J866_9RHOB|nr:glycosyltransferase family 2 protein [Paracoccus sp. 2205BS29-5]MDP5305997.1 glycosyltransferase family 2 protein [Paracoccus sp. 2205BS29-5]
MARVLTVILNWRTAPMTLRSAEAAIRAMDGIEGGIVIVDNDSGDGSEEVLRRAVAERGWDRVRVIQSGRNGGFGAGNNVGIRAGLPDGGRPDFVYLLNSDAFPAADAIRLLLDHLQASPGSGMAGSYIHGTDDAPHVTCFRFPSVASELEGAAQTGPISRLLRHAIIPQPIPQRTTRMDWVAGASLMMRQDMLDRIGAFDEEYFLYFEETDLCLRAARAGWQTDYVPASRVAHIGSASTGMKEWARTPGYWFDSRWRYFRKNHGLATAIAATLAQSAGLAINRLRLMLGSSRRSGGRRFARDLLAHDIRALATGIRPAAIHPDDVSVTERTT